MKDTGNITIVLLTVTAVILTTMLIAVYFQTSQTSLAEGPARSGNYIMTTGRWNVDVDLTWVINLAAQQLNIYYANPNTNEIELIDSVSLQQTFGP